MILALPGALIAGLVVGLLGSGGSILTVPILVFLLDRPEKIAIAESLAIVGVIALCGSVPYVLRKQVAFKTAGFFAIPGVLGAYIGAYISDFVSGNFQLTLFGIVMLAVAWSMWSYKKFQAASNLQIVGGDEISKSTHEVNSAGLTIIQGFLIGCLTGFIGAGGGFLIVPALVLWHGMPMVEAIGTSLIVISSNAFTGFIKQWDILKSNDVQIDWNIITVFAFVGIIGSLSGGVYAKKISQNRLRKAFAISLVCMGMLVLVKNLPGVFF